MYQSYFFAYVIEIFAVAKTSNTLKRSLIESPDMILTISLNVLILWTLMSFIPNGMDWNAPSLSLASCVPRSLSRT